MKQRNLFILRLNHRIIRDKRVTSHLFLAARALGATGAYYGGEKDQQIEKTIKKVNEIWGGNFKVRYIKNWKKKVNMWRETGIVVHLTMYGLPIQNVINNIRKTPGDILILVGGAKVPSIVYKLSDWNLSITNQPHSEISALSVFLNIFFSGHELKKSFKHSRFKIMPEAKGKNVIKTNLSFLKEIKKK